MYIHKIWAANCGPLRDAHSSLEYVQLQWHKYEHFLNADFEIRFESLMCVASLFTNDLSKSLKIAVRSEIGQYGVESQLVFRFWRSLYL